MLSQRHGTIHGGCPPWNNSCAPFRPMRSSSTKPILFRHHFWKKRSVQRLESSQTRAILINPAKNTPEQQKTYRLSGVTSPNSKNGVIVTTDLHDRTKNGKAHTIVADLPRPMGQDLGPEPVELLLAAWMGCTQATGLFVSRKLLRLRLQRLEFVDVTAQRDERGALQDPSTIPSRVHTVTGKVVVHLEKSQTLTGDQLATLQEETERRCPVANMMIASGCTMNVKWIDGSLQDGNTGR